VVTLTTVTPVVVPGTGQQLFVGVGGLKVQVLPHSTVLFGAQFTPKGPFAAEMTVYLKVQEALLPAQSVTVTVMG